MTQEAYCIFPAAKDPSRVVLFDQRNQKYAVFESLEAAEAEMLRLVGIEQSERRPSPVRRVYDRDGQLISADVSA